MVENIHHCSGIKDINASTPMYDLYANPRFSDCAKSELTADWATVELVIAESPAAARHKSSTSGYFCTRL